MKTEFNHAAMTRLRSSSKKSPVVGAAIVVAMIVVAIWLKMHA
jgi:flagellin-like protein